MYRHFARYNSSCATKFNPLIENYKTLRHVHFPGITPFANGQKIQQDLISANLDFKKMESKIKKQQKAIEALGHLLLDYEEGIIGKVLEMKPFPTLLTFEFENVYTGGKKETHDPDLPRKIAQYESLGCKYHQLERGGQTTWHGKGQLTAYLILDLKKFENLTVKCYVESVLLKAIQVLLEKNYGLKGYINENPGVWMLPDNDKIASVGTNIQRAITSYGIALNVDPDLKFLNTHVMCGLPGTKATSIKTLRPDLDLLVKDVAFEFSKEVAKRLNIQTVEHMNADEMGM